MQSINYCVALIFVAAYVGRGACSKPRPSVQRAERAPQEGDACELDGRTYSVEGDQSVYLICDITRKLRLHKCTTKDGINGGLFKIYDPKRGICIEPNREFRWLLHAPPMNIPTKKVGDACVVNRDCADGMYCNASNGGICACYLNYIEINYQCVRITSVCQGTTFYPEAINGKPKICSASSPCPPGYVCRLETSGNGVGQEQGFCCLATANEVCGQNNPYIINGQAVACYYPNTTDSCPATHQCQFYQPANRYYCCQNKPVEVPNNGSTSAPVPLPASTKARHVQHPDSFCTNNGIAYLYDGYPIVCNPNNSASCPKDFPCQKNERINLHFCCQNMTNSQNHLPSAIVPPSPPPSPPPPPPLPPFSNLFIPETTATATSSAPIVTTSAFPANLGNVVGGAMAGRPVDVCGSSARPFIFDGRLVTCNVNDVLSCPPTYSCTVYQPFNASFCCRSSSPSESHLPAETTLKPETTSASSTPSTSTAGSTTGKVPPSPSSATSTVCGTWGIPYTFEGYPVTCVHQGLNSTCPPGHICQLHPPSNAHFCCRSPDSSTSTSTVASTTTQTLQPFLAISNPDGCPPQTYAARDHNGVIQVCDLLLAPDSCPTGTGCLYSALFGRYQCCGARLERWPLPATSTSTPPASSSSTQASTSTSTAQSTSSSTSAPSSTSSIFTIPFTTTPAANSSNTKKMASSTKYEECPPGQISYKDPAANDTLSCAANHADSCPGGYFCQWSQNSGKFLCCGVSAGCPNHGVAYVSAATWEVQRCSMSDPLSSCPPGYSCQITNDASSVCCAGQSGRPPVLPPVELPVPNVPLTNIIAQPAPVPQMHLCPVGLPLNDQQAGGYRTCSEVAVCPAGYQCLPSSVGTVCCPIYVGKGPNPLWYFHSPVNTRSRSRNARTRV